MGPNQHVRDQDMPRRLPRALEALLDEASGGPKAEFRLLFIALMPDYPKWLKHPRIRDLFVRQFDEPPPYDVVWSPSVDAAAHALMGLALAIGGTQEERHSLRETILSRWVNIWPWISFLYYNFSLFTILPLESDLLRDSLHRLFVLLVGDAQCTSVVSTKGVLKLAFAMWIHLVEPLRDGEDARASVLAVSDIVLTLVKSSSVDIEELRAAVGFKKRQAVEDLCKPIQISIRGGPAWAQCLCLILEIHHQICRRTPLFYGSLPTNPVISSICHALSAAIAALGPATGIRTMAAEYARTVIVVSSALLIGYSSQAAKSYSWAIYALRCNILSLLFNCRLRIQDDVIRSAIDAILYELKIHSMYRPVLRHLTRALVDPPLAEVQDERAWTAWRLFSETVSSMHHDQMRFDQRGEYSPSCNYPDCGTENKLATKVRRCLGCKLAWYCSIVCQRLDWSKHRNVCGRNRPSRDPLEHPRTQRFFRYLVDLHILGQRTSVADDLHRYRLNDPTPQRLILLVDYSMQIPPQISIHPLDYIGHFTLPETAWKPILLPCVRVRYGARDRELIFSSDLHGELFGWFQRPDSDD